MRQPRLLGPTLTVIASATAIAQSAAPARPPLTVDWLMSDSVRRAAALPQTGWLANGTLLLLDPRLPAAQRTIERVDPATGTRQPIVDPTVALASLNALLPETDRQPSLSWPDDIDGAGTRALYAFAGDLFLLDLSTSRFTRLTHTPVEVTSAQLSPNGQLVAFVRANDLYVIDLRSRHQTRLPLATFVDFQPADPRVITQRYPKAGMPNPAVRVGIVGVGGASPHTTWMHVTAGDGYLLRVNWLPDARSVAVETLARDQHTLTLSIADAQSGAARHVLDEHDSAWVNIHDDLHFLGDGRSFLWASERDDYYHIYRYDLSGRLINQVTRGDAADASSGAVFWVRQAVAGVDGPNDWMYFTSMRESPLERHLYRVHLDGSGLTRLTTDPGTHQIDMSPDARWFVDGSSTARTLPKLQVWQADGARRTMTIASDARVMASSGVQYPDLIHIPARDGFSMPASVLRPPDFRSDRRYPVIMEVYGGASGALVENAWTGWTLIYQLLVDRGFVVVRGRLVTHRCVGMEQWGVRDAQLAHAHDAVRRWHRGGAGDRLALLRHQVGRGVAGDAADECGGVR